MIKFILIGIALGYTFSIVIPKLAEQLRKKRKYKERIRKREAFRRRMEELEIK